MFKFEISKVAETLVDQSKLFNCDLKTAWKKWIHPAITEQYTYEEVKLYIEHYYIYIYIYI